MEIDNLKRYILEFTAFGKEPLHILFGALSESKMCDDPNYAIHPILQLVKAGYLECYHHSGWAGDEYEKCTNLTEENLERYINIHAPNKFKEYPGPEEGGEFLFVTTEKGRQLIPDTFA